MTKKDYIKMAAMFGKVMGSASGDEQIDLIGQMIAQFVEIAKKDNPRFDTVKFMEAVKKEF